MEVDKKKTLVEVLQWRAEQEANFQLYTFLEDGEEVESHLNLGTLDAQACSIAQRLMACTQKGDRALLLYSPGLEFVSAFFGCLYAGVVAVPVYPPRRNKLDERLLGIARDARPAAVLTTGEIWTKFGTNAAETPHLRELEWLVTDTIQGIDERKRPDITIGPEDLAFLQYTSGSTGRPKGVMVSHENLMHNERQIATAVHHTRDSIVAGWLPLFHDMGLVGNLLQPLYMGIPLIWMPPMAFLQKPVRWLQMISRYQATTSGGPNFAYDLCVEKINAEQCKGLDLSSWQIAFNGAEPIRSTTIERFTETFSPYGFRPEAMYPCYGMAEATLNITRSSPSEPPALMNLQSHALEEDHVVEASPNDTREQLVMVSSGRSAPDQRIRIVNPLTRELCPPEQVGEIWVSGKSVAQGYWGKSELTTEIFHATIANTDEGPFLRTGDLGFLDDGELYISGRLKDLIIIRGRNHYPQDIEETVAGSYPALRVGSGAAFAIEQNDTEQLVIVQEVERSAVRSLDIDAVTSAIIESVAERHELQVHAILLLRPLSIPKTSSGKIQRHACKARYLENSLKVIAEWERGVADSTSTEPAPTADDLSAHSSSQNGATTPLQGDAKEGDVKTAETIQAWLVDRLAHHVRIASDQIDVHRPFATYGLDSATAVTLSGELETWLGREVAPTIVYDHPSIAKLTHYLASDGLQNGSRGLSDTPAGSTHPATTENTQTITPDSDEPIAIIGVSCRFPGADSPTAYWHLLRNGLHAIREVPPTRWDAEYYHDPRNHQPGKISTREGGFIDNIDQFDATFFGISPREANALDPQQRLLLEVAWETLEDAGQSVTELAGSQTGVFVGIASSEYGWQQAQNPAAIDPYWCTGNALSVAANRLSYTFDLRGPSLAVDTACSSSLVAVHLACQSLRSGESTLALAGGANLMLNPAVSINFSLGGGLSPSGRCRAFDANADGMVRSEGIGLVALKPLSQAIADGDPVYAVIRSSAVNQDGQTNGITAPNQGAQEAVLMAAYQHASISPTQIQYVETHGTGTLLGDPIEASALGAVLCGEEREAPCRIGSVKSNIGHLEAAAGVASLIKMALAFKHGEIPPSLHFDEPNPYIPFEALKLQVVDKLEPWPEPLQDGLRTAAVSGFGFGGTNAHIVLSDLPIDARRKVEARNKHVSVISAPSVVRSSSLSGAEQHDDQHTQILTLSAQSESGLHKLADTYKTWLTDEIQDSEAELPAIQQRLENICYTASARRDHHSARLAIVWRTLDELHSGLDSFLAEVPRANVISRLVQQGSASGPVFVFGGNRPEGWAINQQLYRTEEVFRAELNRCDGLLRNYVDWSLIDVLRNGEQLQSTQIVELHCGMFAMQVALAALWRSWGITPSAVVGHSFGEVAAAHVAGALTLADAVQIIYTRSALIANELVHATEKGAMAAVELERSAVEKFLNEVSGQVCIAVHNGPTSVVLSGQADALDGILAKLKEQDIFCRRYDAPGAGHSPQMAPLAAQLATALEGIEPHTPEIPLISTVTGRRIEDEVLDSKYWASNLSRPVLFADAMNTLAATGHDSYLEIGPYPPILTPSVAQALRKSSAGPAEWQVLPALRRNVDERTHLFSSLAALYASGAAVDWEKVYSAEHKKVVPLPSYPWQRGSYWMASPSNGSEHSQSAAPAFPQPVQHSAHLLGAATQFAANSAAHYWQRTITPTQFSFVKDFAIQECAAFPSAAYLEMAFMAAQECWGSDSCQLLACSFFEPLVFADDSAKDLQVILTENVRGQANFQVFSRVADGSAIGVGEQRCEWTIHAEGTLLSQFSMDSQAVALSEVRHRTTDTIDQSAYYGLLNRGENRWGPSLQNIEEIWRSNDGTEVLAALCPSKAVQDEATVYKIHPAFLDTCFHLLGSMDWHADNVQAVDDLFLPTSVDSIVVHRYPNLEMSERFWCYAQIDNENDGGGTSSTDFRADIALLDDDGQTLVKLSGVSFVQSTTWQQQNKVSGWFYDIAWWGTEQVVLPNEHPQQKWLIFVEEEADCHIGDTKESGVEAHDAVGVQIGTRLSARGDQVCYVYRGAGFGERDDGHYTINPQRPDDFSRLVQSLAASEQEYRLLYLWGEQSPFGESGCSATDIMTHQVDVGGSLLLLVQALTTHRQTLELWLVTIGAQAVSVGPVRSTVDIAQAPLWGLGRVLCFEHPELSTRLVDLSRSASNDELNLLLQEFATGSKENQVVLRDRKRYIPRLRRCELPPTSHPQTMYQGVHQHSAQSLTGKIRPQSTYLITGGLSGLGLTTVQWMVTQGATHFVLLARSNPSERAQGILDTLQQAGVAIHVAQADVTDREALLAVIAAVRDDMPPLCGIVHSAGLLDDALLVNLTPSRLQMVMAPKVMGAWHLHELTLGYELDFFVLFSSAASLLGSPGQGNYVAANAFLDSFARYRQQLGLPATAINWGPWGDVGGLARMTGEPRLALRGMASISPADGMMALGHVLNAEQAQIGVMDVSWEQLGLVYPRIFDLTFFDNLLVAPQQKDAVEKDGLTLESLRAAEAAQRPILVQEHLVALVSYTLGIPPSELDAQQPLNTMGLDSLMALELKNQLESTLSFTIPTVKFLQGPSVEELGRFLLEKIADADEPINDSTVEQYKPFDGIVVDGLSHSHKASSGATYPLSYGQQALWFIYQSDPEGYAYNISLALNIKSALSIDRLRSAFEQLTSRHPALRTRFVIRNEQPMQEVLTDCSVDFTETDVALIDDVALNEMLTANLQRAFVLEDGYLLRVVLYRRAPQENILQITIHHMISDGWSLWMMMDELRALYAGDESISKSPQLDYGEFVRWQSAFLEGTQGAEMGEYWRRQLLAENVSVLDLPTDRPRSLTRSHRTEAVSFDLDPQLTAAVKEFGREQGATLFTVLVAAYQILLYRHTGQDDITVGTPTTGRAKAEFANIIGYFVNLVVIRAAFAQDMSLSAYLQQMRQTVLDAVDHQDYPFSLIVKNLKSARDPSRTPLFEAWFALQRPQLSDHSIEHLITGDQDFTVQWGDLTAAPYRQAQQDFDVDLGLNIVEVDDRLRCYLQYNAVLFDSLSMTRMADHYQILLADMVAQPETPISQLRLLSVLEKQTLLEELHVSGPYSAVEHCVHTLFDLQAQRSPNVVCIVDDVSGQTLTYRELEQRANQLAHYLAEQGIGAGDLVPIFMTRGVKALVAMLGVLKVGGAYVPLDVSYPQKRIAFMLADVASATSGASLILTQQNLQKRLPEADGRVICLDVEWAQIGTFPQDTFVLPAMAVDAESMAYVMYTSGSTGQPKGVCIPHRAIVRLVQSTNFMTLDAEQIFLHLAPISFDASTLEIWGSLLNGGKMVILPQAGPTLVEIADAIERHQITAMWLTSALFNAMVDNHLDALCKVRQLLAGGEALSIDHVTRTLQKLPPKHKLINGYGPTENTTFTCCHPMSGDTVLNKVVPIGRPIANTTIYILDAHMAPVPAGVKGELYAGGAGVGLGYLNQPELTSARFVNNPFGAGLLYKTGDLCRFRTDGTVEFMGRIDQQIKLRGFRIELGEIEAKLEEHPSVQQAVVVLQTDGTEQQRLVGYWAAATSSDENILAAFLKENLPGYMVPARLLQVESIPLTTNGKVDRRALPRFEFGQLGDDERVLPRTEDEQILADIWCQVLGLEEVGIHDNFFQAGGDSILGLQIISRAKQAGFHFSPAQLFQHQTIVELAVIAERSATIQAEQGLVAGSVPLTPIQRRFFTENRLVLNHYNQTLIIAVDPDVETSILSDALTALYLQHDALRLRFQQTEDGWIQEYSEPQDTICIDEFDLSKLSPQEQEQEMMRVALETHSRISLTTGELLRCPLFRRGSEEPAYLQLIIHHLAVDGVSWRILLEDLASAYEQRCLSEEILLPPKTTSFKAWADRLLTFSREERVQKQAEYWLAHLGAANNNPLIDFPVEHNTGPNRVDSTDTVTSTLATDRTNALLRDALGAYNTQVNDLLLTALACALMNWTERSSHWVLLEGHGRVPLFEDIDLSRTVGWFTTITPVLLDLTDTHTQEDKIKTIKELLRVIPDQGLPYGLLRWYGDDDSQLKLELFEQPGIVFNYLGRIEQVPPGSFMQELVLSEAAGLSQHVGSDRDSLISITAYVVDDQLHVRWDYSRNLHNHSTIEKIANAFITSLTELVDHCLSPQAKGYTPSDFPDANLDQQTLDKLLTNLQKPKKRK